MHIPKHFTSIGKWLLFFCLGMLLWACSSPPTSRDDNATTPTEKTTMNLAQHMETNPHTTPPIDGDAPARFETASFGMG